MCPRPSRHLLAAHFIHAAPRRRRRANTRRQSSSQSHQNTLQPAILRKRLDRLDWAFLIKAAYQSGLKAAYRPRHRCMTNLKPLLSAFFWLWSRASRRFCVIIPPSRPRSKSDTITRPPEDDALGHPSKYETHHGCRGRGNP